MVLLTMSVVFSVAPKCNLCEWLRQTLFHSQPSPTQLPGKRKEIGSKDDDPDSNQCIYLHVSGGIIRVIHLYRDSAKINV